jgi:hypothetical protein
MAQGGCRLSLKESAIMVRYNTALGRCSKRDQKHADSFIDGVNNVTSEFKNYGGRYSASCSDDRFCSCGTHNQ